MAVSSSFTGKRAQFYNPIAGKPTKIAMSSLFLISPASLIKLYGFSIRGTIVDSLGEKFYKKWERVSAGKQPAKQSMLFEMMASLSPENPWRSELAAAVAGNQQANQRLTQMGLWEAYLQGASKGKPLSARQQYICSIERASRLPQQLIEQGAFSQAAEVLAKDEYLSLFLWPEALNLIDSAQNIDALLPLNASVALEVLLSILAGMDVEADESASAGQCVMPSAVQPGCNPTKLFFEYLKRESRASTMRELAEHKGLAGQPLEMATLKRWSAGTHHPDPVWLRPIIKAIWGDADYAAAWDRYWAAKYLNYIGYLAQLISGRAQKYVGTDTELLLYPWPKYPFGYDCFEDWVEVRYPFWLSYHRQQAAR